MNRKNIAIAAALGVVGVTLIAFHVYNGGRLSTDPFTFLSGFLSEITSSGLFWGWFFTSWPIVAIGATIGAIYALNRSAKPVTAPVDHPAVAELAALKGKVTTLSNLNKVLLGWSSVPATIDETIRMTMEGIANGKAETKALGLLDATFASFAGLPTTAEGARGAMFAHVQGSAHVQGTLRAENEHLKATSQNLRDNLKDYETAMANSRTTIADLQATLAAQMAKEAEVLNIMRDLVKASKAGNSAKLAEATAKAEALEKEVTRLTSLTQAAIGGLNQQQRQQPHQGPRPNPNQGQPQPANP
jgi:hypothetical protein